MTEAERLVDDHYLEVYRLALRLLANRDDAVDLTQEVFRRAIKALPGFRGDSSPRTWLYRIALNEFHRGPQRPASVGLAVVEHYASPDPGPDRVALARLDAARLHDLVGGLSSPYREAVVLHYLQNLSVVEVATLLGTRENTVKTWLHRARAQLREAWGQP